MDMTNAGETDYSDYETQIAHLEFVGNIDDTQDRPRSGQKSVAHLIEPLDGVGGLSQNEVAELMYLETSAYIETEDEFNDQNTKASLEHRGAVGINLPERKAALPRDFGVPNETSVIDSETDMTADAFRSQTQTDNAYLQHYETYSGIGFDDETNGPGGAYTGDHFHAEKNFRATHNRGPVLDSNDDLVLLQSLNAGDIVGAVTAVTKLTMYFDVAETSDAGRRFSLPR